MNSRRSTLAALAVLPLLAAAAGAQDAPSFDQLQRTGFRAVSASVAAPSAAPAAALAQPRVAGEDRGVFLFSDLDGRVAFCSAAGCRTILDGGASTVVRSKDGLYFSGPEGTGFCAPGGCAELAPAVQMTLTLAAGPAGDVYGVNKLGVWHCTPATCVRALALLIQADSNYLNGVWKTDGDFVGSQSDLTFWCSGNDCRRVADAEILPIEDNCGGAAPPYATYGIWAHSVYRCTAQGCATVLADDKDVDDYASCAFDAEGRLHVPAKRDGSVICGETCRTDPSDAIAYPAEKVASAADQDDFRKTGSDGAVYTIGSFDRVPAPAQNGAQRLPPALTRTGPNGTATLSFDAPVACASWFASEPGYEDEDGGDHWEPQCRLIP